MSTHRPLLPTLLLLASGAAILGSPSLAHAGTVVSGPVSGIWDLAGSPYWVEGDLVVGVATQLAIEPGVAVRFRGPYRLLVQGRLTAAGTESDSIVFTWDEPIPAHEWRGVRLVAADAGTLLEYCRIEHVRAATAYPDVRGGAIYCEGCSPVISHCLLQHNVSHNSNSNGMGGGVACVEASPLIEFCVIRANQADSGGGVATIEIGSAVIRNNVISSNTSPYAGGGIYAGVRSSPVIENNLILDNHAAGWGGGGITLWNWYAMNFIGKTVRNNVVARNSTSASGGGFYIRYDYSILENNTVAANTAGVGGGIYVLNQGPGDYPPYLHNFVIWGNAASSGPSIYADPSTGSAVVVAYCDVAGGWAGPGNINMPPLYEGENYRLAASSAGVDAGDPDPAFDDACLPPSQGTARNDMGAYGGPLACQWPAEFSSAPLDRARWQGPPCGQTGSYLQAPALAASPDLKVSFGVTATEGALPPAVPVHLGLFDSVGRLERLVYVGPLTANELERTVSLRGLPAGPHYLRLQTPRGERVRSFVLVK